MSHLVQRNRWSRLALAALAVAVLGSWSAAPGSAQTRQGGPRQGNQGLQGGWAVDNRGTVLSGTVDLVQYSLIQEAGAGWVRVNFRLGGCFKDWDSMGCNGRTALRTYDEVVKNAADKKLKVLGLLSNESWIGGQAQWTALAAETTGGNGDNRYIREFADKAAGVLAKHFKGRVDHWEIWNEPNAFAAERGWPGKVTGISYMYPSNFAWLLRHSYDAIKGPIGANPAATVISGGILSHDVGGVLDSGADYLSLTYSKGERYAGWQAGKYPLDGVGQHLYIDQGRATTGNNLTNAISALRAAYLNYEGGSTPKRTYVTEIGWAATADIASQKIQADNLQIAYVTFKNSQVVARAYWFFIQDIPSAGLLYGLVDAGGVRKPAFSAYKTHAI